MNPLVDLKGLSLEDLQKKYSELTQRMHVASATNSNVIVQMHSLMQAYRAEIDRRTVEKDIIEDPENKAGVILDTDDPDAGKKSDEYEDLINIT